MMEGLFPECSLGAETCQVPCGIISPGPPISPAGLASPGSLANLSDLHEGLSDLGLVFFLRSLINE